MSYITSYYSSSGSIGAFYRDATYLDEHLDGKYRGEDVIGGHEEEPLATVRRYVRSLHRQGDAVQADKEENRVVEPLLIDEPTAESSKSNGIARSLSGC